MSLDVGENVAAKQEFETWLLEEAHVAGKHCHSNNGLFRAELFTESCKEDSHTQNFSGVGAQCKNAEAERTIQTSVCVIRSFTIHTALNWGENNSDAMSF